MRSPSQDELRTAIRTATRLAVTRLFREHPGQFYYCSLITTGEAHAPFVAAWSREALAQAVANNPSVDPRLIEWSYADSPFAIFGEEHFAEVQRLFDARPQMDYRAPQALWDAECEQRLGAMELAMSDLDAEGLFGQGAARLQIVVNVEVMPPDYTNTLRALRLNPREALTSWLADVAEALPGCDPPRTPNE